MSRDVKASSTPASRSKAAIEIATAGDAALVNIVGLVDERFPGFGDLANKKAVILNVAGISRMTSFGVRQWLNGIEALPKSITDLYLLGCPTFFVDQLNMVLNFGGASKVLTVIAPYTCPSCGVESGEMIDVLAERANLAKGGMPEKACARCSKKLEFDETPESYFAFVNKYAASSIEPAAAALLAAHNLYTSLGNATEKPPRITKLVHGSVTYFRITGTIGSMFRARPFLVGAEGEVVIDLAEVDRFDAAGQKEWRRLLKSLAKQVPSVSLVDVNESFLSGAGDTLALARNIAVASVLVPYVCTECGRTTRESAMLDGMVWPLQFPARVCATCGGATQIGLSLETLVPLQKASTSAPAASAKMIEQRDEILSRALTDANVAQAGEGATAAVAADDTILGKYKIVRRLSAGGMAEVFLAKQVGIGGFEKHVALKRIQRKLLDSRHQAIELFLNEAKIAGRLAHPNIVQVLDVGEVQGALYLAMEYVHGKDLRAVVRRLQGNSTAMPLAHACFIIREVAQALHHAYWSMDMGGKRLSVVHRDVSPHNVILSYEGTVKLLDFGVAMSAVTEHAETMIVGKWLYMSPETTANKQIDHRSDLFSLGVILYLLCAGVTPFTGPEPKEIVKKIRGGIYKPLQELVPEVPERLAALVHRMLSPNPDHRPQRGQEVVAELTEIARTHNMESTGPDMASFLAQLFPEDVAGSLQQELQRQKELARTGGEEIGSLTTRDRSAGSITPSGVSGVSRSLPAVDVSQTYRRSGVYDFRSSSMALVSPPSTPSSPSPIISPPSPIISPPSPTIQPRVSFEGIPMVSSPRRPRVSAVWIVTMLTLLAILAGIGTFLLFSS
ncbi:MAG: serine/threonine protein kinase [Myxococcota bacterium]|nr:serine/threonine protein kinase [Myxococcota bacterium]